ncbi:hypothetical protein [Arenibaculum pallidiluteum]|uniref:hypothetical protein n=1 Tax=Arenibaculum pallidiluteum TaxID=2812559 RepID=UPI001A965FE3|nr:hypothetical protein [Arenibaculum pallidiluteum]
MTIPSLSTNQSRAIVDAYRGCLEQGHAVAMSAAIGVYRHFFGKVPATLAADEVATLVACAPLAVAAAAVPYRFCE